MNSRFKIECAKVSKKGKYSYGNNNGREWASINLKVEWTVDEVDANNQPLKTNMSAVVRVMDDLAVWVRDNVTEGNKFATQPVPYTYLNLLVHPYGEFRETPRKDGQGTWEDISNVLFVDSLEVIQQTQKV